MIAGVGVDVCEIARMEKIISDSRFLTRFFAPEEQAYIADRGKGAAQTAAGLFAAKEALVKALGTGFSVGKLSEICVLHDVHGAPYYDLRGEVAQHAAQCCCGCLHLSISHDGGVAVAFCVAERTEKR